MKTLDLIQGSDEWHAARAKHLCASEAPAMMGASKHTTRNELLRMKATGDEKEFSEWAQKNLLDQGHAAEESARVIFESHLDDELYPMTGTDDEGRLLASFDGITMSGETGFEHKLWNAELAEAVLDKEIPPSHYWQLEHQMLVGDLTRVVFVVSDGTQDRMVSCLYESDPERRKQLIAGWKQFEEDVANYQHVETAPAPTGKAIAKLPTLDIQLVGEVRASNLVAYKASALALIESINTDLQTDQDFADAENLVKFCAGAEKEIESGKKRALAQTASIDELFGTMDEVSKELRSKRLTLDKLIKSRKQTIRAEIVGNGGAAFRAHLDKLNTRLGRQCMPLIDCDFAGAAKGKRTIDSLRNAVDTELASAKIKANEVADKIQLNINTLREVPEDKIFLFPDALQEPLVLKANDDFAAMIKVRIAEHEAAEAKRLEAERERIREEEAAKIEAKRKREAEKAAAAVAVDLSVQTGRGIQDFVPQKRATETQATSIPQPQAKPTKPTDDDIIEVLALHYRVHESKVVQWLIDMDLEAASKNLEKEFA